ncbi:hypothetical protein CEV31_0424 [Brucella thiophenivorans]|uniref:Uncharacterized protein n=1 Tax=Brucella thiophenivorans TaxID=571255 RepID=A0A256G4M1_9HYPH|nr:hypothetical protein CEV31_0424 [Brucella thiophenivorans]
MQAVLDLGKEPIIAGEQSPNPELLAVPARRSSSLPFVLKLPGRNED